MKCRVSKIEELSLLIDEELRTTRIDLIVRDA
jgi:hypothetical protein